MNFKSLSFIYSKLHNISAKKTTSQSGAALVKVGTSHVDTFIPFVVAAEKPPQKPRAPVENHKARALDKGDRSPQSYSSLPFSLYLNVEAGKLRERKVILSDRDLTKDINQNKGGISISQPPPNFLISSLDMGIDRLQNSHNLHPPSIHTLCNATL